MARTATHVGDRTNVRDQYGTKVNTQKSTFITTDKRVALDLLVVSPNAKLSAIDVAPDEALPASSDRNRMVSTTTQGGDSFSTQAGNLHRTWETRIIAASVLCSASLPIAVQPPGPDIVSLINGERVV